MISARTPTRYGPTSNPEPTMANPEPSMAQRNPDGYSRVEHELAILVRRAHASSGDLSR